MSTNQSGGISGGISIQGMSGGELYGVGVQGQNVTVGRSVTIGAPDTSRVPDRFAESLKAFSDSLNERLQALAAPPAEVAPLQQSVESLAQVAERIEPEQPLPGEQKRSVRNQLENIAAGLLRVLPETAQTIAAMTPLAPFSALIGKGLDEVVKSVQEG